MTYFEAIELSLKVWIWLFKNPGKGKEDSPYLEDIECLYANCSLCEYHDRLCKECILYEKKCCFKEGGYAYQNWCIRNYISTKSSKSAAAKISSVLRREYIRLMEESLSL